MPSWEDGGVERGIRPTTAGALALAGLAAVLTAAAIPLAGAAHESVRANASGIGFIAVFVSVGALVASRLPRHPMGWMFLLVGVFFVLNADASAYNVADYREHAGLPFGGLSVILQPSWAPAILLFGLVILVFPDGRLPSPRWRFVLAAYLAVGLAWAGGAIAICMRAVAEHHVRIVAGGDLYSIDHPNGETAWWGIVQDVFFPTLAAVLLLWIAAQVPLYRRAGAERRQQLKWLVGGGVAATVGGALLVSDAGPVRSQVGLVGISALPVSLGIAILRYRLYDIDVIIRRTIVYASLVAALVVVYLSGIFLIGRALQTVTGQSGALAVTISTLAAATAFQPLRRRLQDAVDHRFFREKYDADRTLALFAGRLRGQIDLDSLQGDIVAVVQSTLQPRSVQLWLRRPG
jgi:hypothetical protein